jgi:enamine deaminase RidA (YjgF/YER057c/UK114 family)
MLQAVILLVTLAQVSAASPPQGSRNNATVIMSTDDRVRQFQQQTGYSDAIAVGGFVFLSGVVAAPRSGETSYEAAYTRAFDQVGQVLGRLGCNWGDVIEMTSFHTDVAAQMPAMRAVKQRYVGSPYPAWTAIGVTRLVSNSAITEIRVTAMCKARLRK